MEIRQYKTEDEYQDAIHDLMKEVEDLVSEAEDKGFSVKKRDEELDQEERALETKEDYQREYDKWEKEYQKCHGEMQKIAKVLNPYFDRMGDLKDYMHNLEKGSKEYEELKREYDEMEKKYSKLKDKYDRLMDKRTEAENKCTDILNEAKKKGFKVKRGAVMSFEERKNSILADITDLEERKAGVIAGLELRALETEKDFQKEYDRLYKDGVKFYQLREKLEDKAVLLEKQLKEVEKEYELNERDIKNTNARLEQLVKDAKSKGFTIKRSESTDYEVRALKTQDDYQKAVDKIVKEAKANKKEYEAVSERIVKDQDRRQECRSQNTKLEREMIALCREALSKGFGRLKVDDSAFNLPN